MNSNKDSMDEKILYQLLGIVSKFRDKIVEQLIKDGKVPETSMNWNTMYIYL